MNNKIIIINGPNLNLLGEREQSQYGSITFNKLKENCLIKSKELGLDIEFTQSNIEGEIVNLIQESRKKFVEVGKKIKKGDTVMIVEAMKTMNHVPSSSDGVVKEICVEDGQPVEFGQTIIILE